MATKTNFYRRILPEICINFSSGDGKLIFKEALDNGDMEIFFYLGPQIRTQDEPAYCGLSSLIIVLNGLAVDPGRVWKGVWRWYHESMLECCTSLEEVQKQGVTMDQLSCIARCNQLNADVVYVDDHASIDEFREVVKQSCRGSSMAVICSFGRRELGQSGSGHFSPIGGYHPGKDVVLVLEPARFKYPPYWLPLEALWNAMNTKDSTNGDSPRGYMILEKSNSQPTLLFRISRYFNAINPLHEDAADFLQKALKFLKEKPEKPNSSNQVIKDVAENLLKISAEHKLNHEKGILFNTFKKSQLESMSPEHQTAIFSLVEEIESLELYQHLRDALTNRSCCSEALFDLKDEEQVLVNECGLPCVLCLPHYMVILLHMLPLFGPNFSTDLNQFSFTEEEFKGSYLEAIQVLTGDNNESNCSKSNCCKEKTNENTESNKRGKHLLQNEIKELRKQMLSVLNKDAKVSCCI
ncbi:glutathione gamma-glutamylcysteinyltransferase-like [Ciona intestinalis]